jgi:ubiquinone/menaquinone biosynthesis C-methylase UbiE
MVPDMLAALREWRRVLVPGGFVGISSFGPGFLQPLRELWEARLRRYGLTAAVLPTHRLAWKDSRSCNFLPSSEIRSGPSISRGLCSGHGAGDLG